VIVLRFLRWLFGYVIFEGRGPFPERFMNLCARGEINLWDVRSKNGVIRACVAKSNYRQLRPVARKSGMRLKVRKRFGLPFHTRKYRGRMGLLVGAVLFFVVLYVLSLYVWDVEVNGTVALSNDQVQQVMAEIGVRPGVLKSEIRAKLMEQQAMVALPELSWIAINQQGSVVSVELKERQAPPVLIPEDEPCNLVASITGQVVRLEIYTGSAAVKAGDAVVKGQLLVNGVVEDTLGNGVLKHASGKVYAATSHTLNIEVPLQQMTTIPSGEVITRRRVSVFGVDLPISVASIPDEGYTCKMTKQPLSIGKAKLPVTVYTETWSRQIEQTMVLSEEQAAQQAKEQLAQKEREELGEAVILNRQETVKLENNIYYLEVVYECEENIAEESPILTQ
jgi:similar to stage IV sporulation protein